MSRWLLAVVLAGCGRLGFEPLAGDDHVQCGRGDPCPGGLSCNPASGSCEAPDGGVVGDDAGLGAGIDAPGGTGSDASFCLGDAMLVACLSRAPAAALTINSPSTIDTDQNVFCSPDAAGSSASYCIVTGTSITITAGQTLRAHGSRPLVLLSSGPILVMGTIDVAGHVLGIPQGTGPGVPAGPASPCAPASLATSAGGGSGGSFGSVGGVGGADSGGHPGGVPSRPVAPTALRGGCSGDAGLNAGGAGGGGGGAVALLAATQIQIDGAVNASGGGGGGSPSPNLGGGGGGAGGMIVIDAPTVTGAGTATIFANGGSGGEGSSSMQGHNGSDAPADPNMAAAGGSGSAGGGDGGDGAIGAAQGGRAAGAGGTGATGGGGGGGGGGVGVIKLYKAGSLPGTVSPPVS